MVVSRSLNFVLKRKIIVWAVDIYESFHFFVLLFRDLFEVWFEKGRNKNIIFRVDFWDGLCFKLSGEGLCWLCLGLLMICLGPFVWGFVFEFLKWVKAWNVSISTLIYFIVERFSRSWLFWICHLWAFVVKCWLSWKSKVFLYHFLERSFSKRFICWERNFSK